jgi:hypothetical protein
MVSVRMLMSEQKMIEERGELSQECYRQSSISDELCWRTAMTKRVIVRGVRTAV